VEAAAIWVAAAAMAAAVAGKTISGFQTKARLLRQTGFFVL
jgi:hypothetical protein